ncbi:LysR family transcriptional regulator [Micromonospora sp. CPCC 206060]|uniref:LysR family transcriptional regulator n=1 Tax=Micromonospora sp. CPCC 206060 TaxID=3122406 RepID=UPI002FF1E9E3
MELRTLRYLLAVADAGSVSAASRLVHVSQPSLSRQLHALEKSLGVRLFDRQDGRLALNAAGMEFLPIARDVVARADLAVRAAAAIRSGALASITISCPGTTLTDVIAPFLATWGAGDPMPGVWEESPSAIYGALQRGADLAIGTEPPPAHLAGMPIAVLPVWAYVGAAHRWHGRRSVQVAEVVDEHLLLLTVDQHARRALDHAVAGAGLGYGTVTEFGTPEVAQAVAAAGRGVAVVSDDARFGLHPVAIAVGRTRLSIRLFAAWPRGHHAEAVIRSIADRLADFCVRRYGRQAAVR